MLPNKLRVFRGVYPVKGQKSDTVPGEYVVVRLRDGVCCVIPPTMVPDLRFERAPSLSQT